MDSLFPIKFEVKNQEEYNSVPINGKWQFTAFQLVQKFNRLVVFQFLSHIKMNAILSHKRIIRTSI